MRYITIALAKGRLAKKAMEIFEQIGIPCEEMKDEKTRKLIFTNEELGFRFFLLPILICTITPLPQRLTVLIP